MATKHNSEILGGIPRGVWTTLWADEQEEKGRSFSGQELTSIAPRTPAFARKWGKQIADEIVRLNGKSLEALYDMAVSWGYRRDRDQFGLELGMQSAGHGISWDDSVPYNKNRPQIELPHREFYR